MTMECRVIFDYDAQEADELTIRKGDIIKFATTKMDGWFEGTVRGKTGVFPDNFVKIITKPVEEPKPVTDGVVLRNNPSSQRRVKVLFSYTPEQDDELALEVGDVLDFIEEVEEGWWRGKLKGKEGIFPSNFVEDVKDVKGNGTLDPAPLPEETRPKDTSRNSHTKGIPDVVPTTSPNQSIEDDSAPPELPPKPVRELARCFYPYNASNEDELTLCEGDIITIISKQCEDEGWWRGELRGKIGLFPDNFVKTITPGETLAGGTSNGPQQKLSAQERNVPHGVLQSDNSKAKKDSISGAGGTVVDGIGMSKSIDKDKSENGISSKIEQAKAKLNKSNSKEAQVPIAPKVGHPATSPISPNIAALHTNLFSNQTPPDAFARKEYPPLKDDKASDESEEFNSVERTETLNHLTANRAKAPKRRPPSTIITRENDGSLVNGSSHSYDNSMSDSPPPHQSTPMNLSNATTNGITSGSFTDGGSLNNSGSFLSQSRDQENSPLPSSGNNSMTSNKSKMQTPPWMAELKQTQDKKRGLVLPTSTTTSSSTSVSAAPPVTTSPAQPTPHPPVQIPPKETLAKAPPLPAKPPALANTMAQEKPVNNMNHNTSSHNSSYTSSNKNFKQKSPSPAVPVPMVSANNNSQLSSAENHRGDGDANSNKSYVSYEEYMTLKMRVTSLENEVEILKRQIKMLMDRDLRGHIV